MLTLIPFVLSLIFLIRTVLIVVGLLKDPILRTFEKYGDDENIYNPVNSLLLWTGLLIISLSPGLAAPLRMSMFTVALPGIAMIGLAYFLVNNPQFVRQYPNVFFIYPRWYHELRSRTTRNERRRIAYKWLWLPHRLRLAYNGNDRAFSQWTDLIIMATMDVDESQEARHDVLVRHT